MTLKSSGQKLPQKKQRMLYQVPHGRHTSPHFFLEIGVEEMVAAKAS